MKRYISLIFAALILCVGANCCANAESGAAEFDESSVIAVIKPRNAMRIFSAPLPFDELGISEIENLDVNAGAVSIFGLSAARQVLKLTLSDMGAENVLKVIDELNKLPDVEYAEPNYIYRISDLPDDRFYREGSQYGLDKINAPAVWDMNIDCSGVTVAVIDTGALMSHPDLADNIWTNPGEIPGDGIDNDNNGYIDDVHGWDFFDDDNDPTDENGHGTHVAGIVSASTNNAAGIASLARNAKIAPLKAFNAKGETSSEYIYKAVNYAREMGFDIVNNSYGGKGKSNNMLDAIKACESSVFIAAAGNKSSDNDATPMYPASYDSDNIISIASTDQNDNLSSFSNYGEESVDIAAPGTRILSTYLTKGSAGYTYLGGTSMACPLAASAAAVMKAKYPDMTPPEIISKLESSADVVGSLSGKVRTGARLNAYEALLTRAENVTLDKSSATLKKGETLTLRAEAYPENTTDHGVWQSSDSVVAAVDNGVVTALEAGSAMITVTYGNASASCEVTVSESTENTPYPEKLKITVDYDSADKSLILTSNSPKIDKAAVIRAAYDKNGAMTDIKIYSVGFSDKETTAKISNVEISENEKIFVWRDISNNNAMEPLSDIFTLPEYSDGLSVNAP